MREQDAFSRERDSTPPNAASSVLCLRAKLEVARRHGARAMRHPRVRRPVRQDVAEEKCGAAARAHGEAAGADERELGAASVLRQLWKRVEVHL